MHELDTFVVLPVPPGHDGFQPFNTEDVVYDILPSGNLPIIDISRSIRTVLFPEVVVKRFDRVVAKTRIPLFIMANIAVVASVAALMIDRSIARWLAIPISVIALPASIVQAMYMRFEIILLLVRTYDFWFFSLAWLGSMVLFGICLADTRCLIIIGMWMAMQTSIMIDASTSQRESVWLTVVGLVMSSVVIAAIAVEGLSELEDFNIFVVNGYVVSAQTVVINGWSTCLLVLVRNIYRRRTAMQDHGKHNKTIVQCLSYRCRVRLRACGRRRRSANSLSSLSTSGSSIASSHMTRPTASYFQNAKMVQMRCMRVKFKINPRNLVTQVATRLLDRTDTDGIIVLFRSILIVLMETGVISTSVSFIPGVHFGCHCVSLATTALFSAMSLTLQHRQLLKYVVFSFDFAFLSFQLTIMHLALCDLYGWDSRALSIVSVWLWFHWVLTFDCIPPVLKTRLQFRFRLVIFIAIQFVIAHICLGYQLVAFDRHTFRDRAILELRVWRFQVHVRVLPLLVSRMVMTFCWSCRIVLRLLMRNENELIIIQGTVTYINNRRKIKKQEAEFLANRAATKSKMMQMTRRLTKGLVAFSTNKVTPLSVPTSGEVDQPRTGGMTPLPTSASGANPRLLNVAGQVYDASRGVSHLEQRRLRARSEQEWSSIESGPMLFQIVGSPQRKGAVASTGAAMKITTLDTSIRIQRQEIGHESLTELSRNENDQHARQREQFMI